MIQSLKRLTAFLLILILVISMVPSAMAAETESPTEETAEETTEVQAETGIADDGISLASEDDGIMLLSGDQLSGVKLLNLASPYNYTCTLSSQVYVKYVPAGTSTAKTAGIQNVAWHYYSYNGVQDKDKTIYCIQPHLDYNQGSSGNYMDQGVDVWGSNSTGSIGSNAWYALSGAQRSAIAYTLLFSEARWNDSYSVLSYSKANNPNYSLRVATQVIIYEIVTGLRDPYSFVLLDSNGYTNGSVLYDAFKDQVTDFRTNYNGLVSDVQNAALLPSFCSSSSSTAPTITLDGVLTWVTDTNGVCGQFTFEEPDDDVWFNVYDTEVGFQNSYGFEGTKLYNCYKTDPSASASSFSIFYGTSTSYQTCVTLHSAATARTTGYFYVYAPSTTGGLDITKTTQDSQNLGNWPFSLYSNSACTSLAYGPYYTNSSGKISITGITPGTYYVKEGSHGTSSINSQYQCSSTNPQTVTITAGGTSSVSFYNTLRPGSLNVIKTTEDSQNLGDWPFNVYSNSACTTLVSGPHYTDSNGKVTISGLTPGTYYIKEGSHGTASINAMYQCSSSNPQTVTITAGGTSSVSFYNTLQLGTLNLTKVTEDGPNRSGWLFSFYSDAACTSLVSGPHSSNANGEVSIQLPPGTYYVKELGNEDESVDSMYYCVSPNPETVTITAGGTTSVTFSNALVSLGSIQLKKDTNTGDDLSGWEIGVFTDSICTSAITGSPFMTGSDGTVTVDNLAPGTYYVKEVDTADPLWEYDSEVKTVTVVANQTATVTFTNNLRPGQFIVHKKNHEGSTLAGAEFLLEWSEDGTFWQAVTSSTLLQKGGCSTPELTDGKLVSTGDAAVIFENLYPTLQYRLTETKAPNNYQLLADTAYEGPLPADNNYTMEVTIVNMPNFALPKTGSRGWIITIVSLLACLSGLAGTLLYLRKRRW